MPVRTASLKCSTPGVLCEGHLLKSPPNLSLRRVSAEKRLQQRWFVLTHRSLTYYAHSPKDPPLACVPLPQLAA